MSEFGIYFGTEAINVTEVKGTKPLTNFSIVLEGIVGSGMDQKFPDEPKIVTALKGAFIKNNIAP